MPSASHAKKQSKNAGLTVISPNAIATYAHVWEARLGIDETKGKQFSIVLLFSKTDDLSKLRAAARKAAEKKWGQKIPSKLKSPFRNGSEAKPDDPIFRGKIFITARSKDRPGIVDQHAQPILEPMDFYSGCKCRASLYAHAYDTKGNKGVTFMLNNLQKVADGTRLSGRKSAEEEFDDIGEDDEEGSDDGMFDD